MRLSVTFALALLAAACAPVTPPVSLDLGPGALPERSPTRAELAEWELPGFLQRAVLVLAAEGHRVAARTATQIVTSPREVDAQCGPLHCRVREVAMIHVSGSTVRLQLVRAVRTYLDASWRLDLDPGDAAETADREARLLQAMLGRPRKDVELSLR